MSFIERPDELKTSGKSLEQMLGYDKGKQYNPLFASDKIRCIICGPSGCGKTTFLLSRLLEDNGMSWGKIFICAPQATLHHPSYRNFKENLDTYQEKIQEDLDEMEYDGDLCETRDVTNIDQIPTVESIPEDILTVMIFDDFMNCDKKCLNKINDIVAYGSKRNIAAFFLVQHLKIGGLTKTRSSADSFILFKGVVDSSWDEIRERFSELSKRDIQNIKSQLSAIANTRKQGTGSPYVIFLLNAPQGKRFLFNDDSYYIPESECRCGYESCIRGGALRAIGESISSSIGSQSRVLCFKNFDQWDSLFTNHVLENGIGNESTQPYINGLWEAGMPLGYTQQTDMRPNTTIQTKYQALYIPTKENLYEHLTKYRDSPMIFNCLTNFARKNGWVSKEAVEYSSARLLM